MSHIDKDRMRDAARNAQASDEEDIRKNLDGMNRGAIQKIWADVQSLWAMVKDPEAPWVSKASAVGSLLYLVSPIDAIPDILPIVGLTDDVGVILAAVAYLASDLKKYKKSR